jgi:signal transduction histidine kinase
MMPLEVSPAHQSNRRRRGAAEALLSGPAGNHHIVQFYESESSVPHRVARFLGAGLAERGPVLIIATKALRQALTEQLLSREFDVGSASRSGQLRILDARDTLSKIMADTLPDRERFAAAIGSEIQGLDEGGPRHRVRVFSELADLLLRDENPQAAMRLEELWNGLGRTSSLSVLCAHALGHFSSEADRPRFDLVCAAHTHVVPTESFPEGDDPDDNLRKICALQQRALALETEVGQRRALKEAAESGTRARSEFLAVMSHELRTPLNAIIGFSELLQEGGAGPTSAEQRTFLGDVLKSSRHLLKLVNDLLELTNLESGGIKLDPAPFDLAAALRDAAELARRLAEGKELSVSVEVGPLLPLTADEAKVREILHLLLANAVKFTPPGGSIRISARSEGEDEIEVSIADTGVGIAARDHQRIFGQFEQADAMATRKFPGAGLGLSLAKRLVELHGGRIWVESEIDQGSTFRFRIPRVPG